MSLTTNFRKILQRNSLLARCWRLLRTATGDDAYERYLAHWRQHHSIDSTDGGQPLSRRAFFRAELERKWNGVRRCC